MERDTLLGDGYRWPLLDGRTHRLLESLENPSRPVHGDAVIFIPLVARNLCFTNAQPIRQLFLREPVGDPERDEQAA